MPFTTIHYGDGAVGKIGNIGENFSGNIGTSQVQNKRNIKDLLSDSVVYGDLKLNYMNEESQAEIRNVLNEILAIKKELKQSSPIDNVLATRIKNIEDNLSAYGKTLGTINTNVCDSHKQIYTKLECLINELARKNEVAKPNDNKEKDRIINELKQKIEQYEQQLRSKTVSTVSNVSTNSTDSTVSKQIKLLQESLYEKTVELQKKNWEIKKLGKDIEELNRQLNNDDVYRYKIQLKLKDTEINKKNDQIEKLRQQIVKMGMEPLVK